jgi:hypothetical protein
MLRVLRYEVLSVARLLTRPALWLLVVLALLGAAAAYQVRHSYDIDVGSPSDRLLVRNFHDPRTDGATGRTFRWSDAYGYVDLPGTGGGVPFAVTLTLNPGRANVPVTVIVNGETFLQSTFSKGWRDVTLQVDASHAQALSARDLVIEIRTPGYPAPDDPTQIQGVMLDRVQISAGGPGIVIPSTTQLVYLVGAILLVYLLLGRIFAPLYRPAPNFRPFTLRPDGSLLPPLVSGLAVTLAFAFLLATEHLSLTAATGELATPVTAAFVASYLVLLLTEPVARRIAPETKWGARALAGMVAVAFLVRFGAVILPQVNIIDLPWHMKWLRELLLGHWQSLYFPGDLSSVPREWGLSVIIPKSPLFYFVAAPLALLPWNQEVSVKLFACLLDVSLMIFCYGLLARYAPALGGWRAGLWAGFAYACNPLSYRSLAYGILPTILAQWLTVASFTVLLVIASRLLDTSLSERRQVGIRGLLFGFFILLAASLVAFPTIAVFNTLVLGIFSLAWLWKRRPQPRRLAWTVAGATAAAWALAIIAYYGQYIGILINTTIPALLNPSAASAQGANPGANVPDIAPSSTPTTVHWNGMLDLLGWTASYLVSLIPLLAGLAGLALLWWATSKARQTAVFGTLMGVWISILPIFLLVNYKVDMIGKHLFYTVVPLSLGGGIFLWDLWQKGSVSRLFVVLVSAALAWTALAFWVQRLVQASG